MLLAYGTLVVIGRIILTHGMLYNQLSAVNMIKSVNKNRPTIRIYVSNYFSNENDILNCVQDILKALKMMVLTLTN